jgi:enamine deaminase RidA (YjgF/YER057c/UK114 family)
MPMNHARRISLMLLLLAGCAAAQQKPEPTKSTAHAKEPTKTAQPFRLFNPDTIAKPVATYSHVAEVTGGKLLFISGQVAVDKAGNLVGKDDFRAQVTQVFENLKGAVQGSGGDFHNIVKLNFYCAENVDPSQLPALREIRDKYIDTANPPTSTFVVVKRLARPEWMLEVEAVAVVAHAK